MTPTTAHAKQRSEVRLADGRRAWLLYIPGRQRHTRGKATVVFATGAYMNVAVEDLEVVGG